LDEFNKWILDLENINVHIDDYMPAKDRTMKMTRAPERYGYAELITFFLVAASEVLDDESSSVSSALAIKEKI